MKKLCLAVSALVAAALVPSSSSADPFSIADQLPILDSEGAKTLLWVQSGHCADAATDADRRVCRQVAMALGKKFSGESFRVRREGHVTAGRFRKRTRSLPILVDACLFCEDIQVSKVPGVVVGHLGKATAGAPLKDTSIVFKSKPAAETWIEEVLPRLVGDLLVSVPEKLTVLQSQQGLQASLEVVAFRIYDPCSGEIVASEPRLKLAPVDQEACDEAKAAAEAAAAEAAEAKRQAASEKEGDEEDSD